MARTVTIGGRASWLVCEKICIPEEARVELTLPVVAAPAPASPDAPLIARARRVVPVASPWPATIAVSPERVVLKLAARELSAGAIADVWFYPGQWGLIEHAAPQEARVDGTGLTLVMARGPLPDAAEAPVEGVLVLKERLDGGTVSQAFVIHGDPRDARAAAASVLSLGAAVGLALLGGLLLNLMPCVLPVLSVKVLALLGHADASAASLRRHGLAHTAGVLACFAALAGALLAFRAGGVGIGWGFQLQSPLVVTVLAYLFFALGLSLSGLLHFGGRLAGVGHSLAARPGYAGSFFTGALVAVAATPCTAPFMGVATGFALTQPAPSAVAVFLALGFGLALPYLVLSLAPAWRRLLPRPGPWMERLKQVLALPLYATVAWLVWVVSEQAGPRATAAALAGLVLIAFAAWMRGDLAGRARSPAAPRRRDGGRQRGPGARRRRLHPRPSRPGGRPRDRGRNTVAGVEPPPARRGARRGQAGLRELHGRLVHHLPRQRAGGPALVHGRRGLPPEERRLSQGRLDQPQPRDRRGPRGFRAERRPSLCAVPRAR